MTLHEARHTLEVANPRDAAIRQAIKVVLTALPADPEPYRPQALKRVDAILAAIARQKKQCKKTKYDYCKILRST